MKSLKTPARSGRKYSVSVLLLILLTSTCYAQTPVSNQVPRRPTLPFYISPAEVQLNLTLDTLQKYETLYRNERAIGATLRRVVGIDTGRLLRKDSLQARTDTVCTATERRLASETKRADTAEQVAAEKDKEIQKLQPGRGTAKTWLGRQLGYAKTGLAALGLIALINWAAH